MRMTPAQCAVEQICGIEMPMGDAGTFKDRIIKGRKWLCEITGQDFGYDLQKWHDYLKIERCGGYTWGKNIKLPKVMINALASNDWHEIIKEIENKT